MAWALAIALLPIPCGFRPLLRPAAHGESAGKTAPHVYARSLAVRLPVQLDEPTRAALSEIRLFVNAPGRSWALVQAAPATQTDFDYRADKDGEYAFLFVTVDKAGRSTPASFESRPPHQIIVIDTTLPELAVQPLPVANHDIFLKCRMIDANPDPASLKLEYLLSDNVWQAMELVSADSPGVFRIPFASVLEGKVRATGTDKAGNTSVRIVDLGDPTRSFNVVDGPKAPENLPTNLVKSEPAGVAAASFASEPAKQNTPADPIVSIPNAAPVSNYNPNRSAEVGKTADVAPPIVDPKNTSGLNVPPPPDDASNVSKKIDPFYPPLDGAEKKTEAAVVKNQPAEAPQAAPAPSDSGPNIREVAQAVPVTQAVPVAQAVPAAQAVPVAQAAQAGQVTQVAHVEDGGQRARQTAENQVSPVALNAHPIINTQRCSFDYAVENIVIGGQIKVEFWGTNDNAHSWFRLRDESGGHIPAKLMLPGDGVFGIRVKANCNGQSPHSGEAPDAWVEVDTTPPNVHLLPPTLGTGADAGAITISWQVQDKNLMPDSINIYESSRPDGPWLSIAANVRNEGSYRWIIPAGIGPQVYFRLEATDRAGNVGRDDLHDPVAMPQPKIRVIGIGPAQ